MKGSAKFPVERGVRRVRVSATLDPVDYHVSGCSFGGYSSSRAIVNLRVMEGSRVDCVNQPISLARLATAVPGGGRFKRQTPGYSPMRVHPRPVTG